jgi:hypothetical protein
VIVASILAMLGAGVFVWRRKLSWNWVPLAAATVVVLVAITMAAGTAGSSSHATTLTLVVQ